MMKSEDGRKFDEFFEAAVEKCLVLLADTCHA